MDERNPKRDLVLAPSEYAYMQDVTKGIVKTYTGPTVINPTAQERPVVFDADKKLFEPCALEEAVQQIAIAPEGYYVAEVDCAVARFGAAQGGFSEALLTLSNHEVLAKVAEAMSVQSFVGGKTLTDVIDKVFAGTPLAGLMDKVKAKTLTNGHALAPVT